MLAAEAPAAAFPAPVVFTDADIEAVLAGTLVTKVVYLEAPRPRHPPGHQRRAGPGNPDARQRGPGGRARCAAGACSLVCMGGRLLGFAEELAHTSVYGTILLPGEHSLAPAAVPPCLLPDPRPFWDPHLGPRPMTEECVHDGGDQGEHAGLDPAGNLHGLDPEDTVAEFTDSHGRRGLTCSNRVCLCVPRFAVLRKECPLAKSETVVGIDNARLVLKQLQFEKALPSELTLQVAPLKALRGQVKPSLNVNEQLPGVLIGMKVLQAQQTRPGARGVHRPEGDPHSVPGAETTAPANRGGPPVHRRDQRGGRRTGSRDRRRDRDEKRSRSCPPRSARATSQSAATRPPVRPTSRCSWPSAPTKARPRWAK